MYKDVHFRTATDGSGSTQKRVFCSAKNSRSKIDKDVNFWTGGSGKTNGVRKKEVVAVEGTENATGNNSEVRRFFEAQGETSPSKSPSQKSPNYSVSFPHVLCYTPLSYEYGKLKS